MTRRCDNFEHLHSAWVDGELRSRERARMAAHLQRCARCRASIAELRVTQAMLRSMPVRNFVVDIDRPAAPAPRRVPAISAAAVRHVLARTAVAAVLATTGLGAAAFVAGAQGEPDREVAVPVDVFVADHLVRAVGGPVSTPPLLNANP